MIKLDIESRTLAIIGVEGVQQTPEEMERILIERKKNWKPKKAKYESGILNIFSQHAVSPMKGGYMK